MCLVCLRRVFLISANNPINFICYDVYWHAVVVTDRRQSRDAGRAVTHGRPHMGSADPPEKMDEKLKSENMQKRAVF